MKQTYLFNEAGSQLEVIYNKNEKVAITIKEIDSEFPMYYEFDDEDAVNDINSLIDMLNEIKNLITE
jgi:hypothetical protein